MMPEPETYSQVINKDRGPLFRFLRNYHWILVMVMLLPGCASRLPASYYPRVASYALQDTADTPLGQAYEQAAKRHPGESGFHILPTGPEALMMRIALIEASRKTLDLQYFSTLDDTT